MKVSSTRANFAYQASYQLLLIIVPLVTTPYLSRVLGPEGVGGFSYTQAVASYFVMFAMLGMSTYGVREVAAAGEDRGARTRAFWSCYGAQLLVAVPACAAYLAYALLADSPGGPAVALSWGLYALSAVLDVSWLLFGCGEFRIPALRSAATKLATLVVIFGFVRGPGDLWLYCAAIAGSFLANQLLIWPFVSRYVGWERPRWTDVRGRFGPNLVLFVPVVAISLYTSLDKVLLGAMAGMGQAGLFEYSEKLSKMPLAVVTALGTVMLPRMTSELAAGNRGKALSLLGDSVWAMEAAAMALAFGIAAIAPEFAPVFLGGGFAGAAPVMAALAAVVPVISATNVIGRQYLVPTGRDSRYTASVCAGAAVNVAAVLALVPQMGAMGAALATVAAELAVLAAQSLFVRGELPLASYARGALPFAAIGLAMAACVRLAASAMDAACGLSPLGLALEVAVGAAVYCALALAWCLATRDERLHRLAGAGRGGGSVPGSHSGDAV